MSEPRAATGWGRSRALAEANAVKCCRQAATNRPIPPWAARPAGQTSTQSGTLAAQKDSPDSITSASNPCVSLQTSATSEAAASESRRTAATDSTGQPLRWPNPCSPAVATSHMPGSGCTAIWISPGRLATAACRQSMRSARRFAATLATRWAKVDATGSTAITRRPARASAMAVSPMFAPAFTISGCGRATASHESRANDCSWCLFPRKRSRTTAPAIGLDQ